MSKRQTHYAKNTPPRKPYQKPRIEQVRLVTHEAVLSSGCKTSMIGGGFVGMSCFAANCISNGT